MPADPHARRIPVTAIVVVMGNTISDSAPPLGSRTDEEMGIDRKKVDVDLVLGAHRTERVRLFALGRRRALVEPVRHGDQANPSHFD